MMKRFLAISSSLVLLMGLAATPVVSSAAAQSCATIGTSTFCGARGSHNTVGRTMIFNNGAAGQRLGSFSVTGTPPRTSVLRGAESRGLAAPRTFTGVATSRRFGSAEAYDSAIARLRAEILAIEARDRLERLSLTPAQEAAKTTLSPALLRALTLAQQARDKSAAEAGAGLGAAR